MFLLMIFYVETIYLGVGVDWAYLATDYGITGLVDGVFDGFVGWMVFNDG